MFYEKVWTDILKLFFDIIFLSLISHWVALRYHCSVRRSPHTPDTVPVENLSRIELGLGAPASPLIMTSLQQQQAIIPEISHSAARR